MASASDMIQLPSHRARPHSSDAGSPQPRPTSRVTLIVGFGIAALAGAFLLSYLMWLDYRQVIHAAEATTRNYAAIIETRLDATLRRIEADLDELAARIPPAALDVDAVPVYEAMLHPLLAGHLKNFPEVNGLRITDAVGERIYTSDPAGTPRASLGDRTYFRELRGDPSARFAFSEVLIGRATRRPVIVIGRGIRDGKGAFRGTVFATIDLSHLERLFQSLEIGAGATFSLYRSDTYTQVLRWPPTPTRLNIPLPQDNPSRGALSGENRIATLNILSSSDGVTRIYSLHRLERFPFFVASGVSRDAIVASWRERALFVALSALFVGGVVIVLLHRLWRAEGELVTLNLELERRVRERTAELENAYKELEAFSYSISHDLRTPLRSISSYARILQSDYAPILNQHGTTMLKRVQDGAKKMGGLIEDLLRLSRVTRVDMSIRDVSLSDLARSIAAEMRSRDPGRNVTVDIHADLSAHGDAGLIAVALENLIGNAWKFTGTRERARIEVGAVEHDGTRAFFVRDNGVGFDMAHVATLFAPFHRLHSERDFSGSGIGLATVKRIVERHGGRVWAHAVVDEGATFYFTLQRYDGDHG